MIAENTKQETSWRPCNMHSNQPSAVHNGYHAWYTHALCMLSGLPKATILAITSTMQCILQLARVGLAHCQATLVFAQVTDLLRTADNGCTQEPSSSRLTASRHSMPSRLKASIYSRSFSLPSTERCPQNLAATSASWVSGEGSRSRAALITANR